MTKCNAKFASCLGKASCPRNLMKAFPQDELCSPRRAWIIFPESNWLFHRTSCARAWIETDEMGLDQAVSSYIIAGRLGFDFSYVS